ncbi:DUF2491 family protein [Pseudomonas sp. Marseille-QA0892]
MSKLKRWLGLEAPLPPRSTAPTALPDEPLGLASGRMVCLDASLSTLLEGHSHVVLPGDEAIWAVGTIELSPSATIKRYYFDNEDYFLQVLMNGPRDSDIEAITLFGYYQSTPINSKDELLRLAGPNSRIGMQVYNLEGEEYGRQWGTEDGQTELVPLYESVVSPEAQYAVQHQSMLYAREIGLLNRRELLLFSVEEDEEGSIALTTAVGVTLQITDFQIL